MELSDNLKKALNTIEREVIGDKKIKSIDFSNKEIIINLVDPDVLKYPVQQLKLSKIANISNSQVQMQNEENVTRLESDTKSDIKSDAFSTLDSLINESKGGQPLSTDIFMKNLMGGKSSKRSSEQSVSSTSLSMKSNSSVNTQSTTENHCE